MTPADRLDWIKLKRLARSLNLPGVHEATRADGSPCFCAHDRLWTWWNLEFDAPGFRLPANEREFLIASDPETFFVSGAAGPPGHVLADPSRVCVRWVLGNLSLSWRALAPVAFVQLFPGAGPPVPHYAD